MKRRRSLVTAVVILILVALTFTLFSHRILWSLGAMLDHSEPPQKADMIVVIGGDLRGSRILLAGDLARQGYAPKVLVTGAGENYGFHESDLAIEFAVKHGYPRELFMAVHYPAVSTQDEAVSDVAELRRLGVHKYLLVTSVYHTARAGRIFRREGPDLEVHMISAPDRYWKDGEWWREREGRKLWLAEVMKTVAGFFGI